MSRGPNRFNLNLSAFIAQYDFFSNNLFKNYVSNKRFALGLNDIKMPARLFYGKYNIIRKIIN